MRRSQPFFAPLALILGALGPKNLYIGDITGRKHFLHKGRHVSRFWVGVGAPTYDIVFFHLYENVEGIIRSRKELMRNTFDFMDEPRRVPQEVCDELGIQLPEPESDY